MRRDEALLLDMLGAAREALSFAHGVSRKGLEDSRLHQQAIVKALEIIGEAASHVSAQMRARNPEINWAQAIGMRHHLVHGYFEIDLDQVWATVFDDLPRLIAQLERMAQPEV